MKLNCKMCKQSFVGRSDKIFCSVACKSMYHRKLNKVTSEASYRIDNILHRNRSILLEILGKHKTQIRTERILLDKKRFNYRYFTSRTVNKNGKVYFHVYDFAYMWFSDETVLIVRKSR